MAGCEPFPEASPESVAEPGNALEGEKHEPTNLEQRLAEAKAAKEAGEYRSAIAVFRDILAANPTVTTAYLGIAEIYLLKKDYGSAEPAFARAARLEPRNFDAQYGHGLTLQMLDRLSKAIGAYHRALTIRPDSVKANLNLATTYLQLGEGKSALVFAEKVVELDPAHGPARANLGAIYEKLGRPTEAVREYEAAVALMEPTPPLLMNLVNALAKANRYREAKSAAEFLTKLEPSANAYERLGWACFRLAEYDKSIEAYRKAVEIAPNHWPSLNGIGCNALNTWLLSEKRDYEASQEGKHAFQRSLRLNPYQPRIIWVLSEYYD